MDLFTKKDNPKQHGLVRRVLIYCYSKLFTSQRSCLTVLFLLILAFQFFIVIRGLGFISFRDTNLWHSKKCHTNDVILDDRLPPSIESATLAMKVLRKYLAATPLPPPTVPALGRPTEIVDFTRDQEERKPIGLGIEVTPPIVIPQFVPRVSIPGQMGGSIEAMLARAAGQPTPPFKHEKPLPPVTPTTNINTELKPSPTTSKPSSSSVANATSATTSSPIKPSSQSGVTNADTDSHEDHHLALTDPSAPDMKLGRHHHAKHGGKNDRQVELVHKHEKGEKSHTQQFLEAHTSLYTDLRLNFSVAWAADILNPFEHHALSEEDATRWKRCVEFIETWPRMVVDGDWNGFPEEHHKEFENKSCNQVISMHQTARYIQNYTDMYTHVWGVEDIPGRIRPKPTPPNTHQQVIAIIHTMTTRGLVEKGLNKVNILDRLVLFTKLWPSLLATVEEGFEYWCYFGFDHGDKILDDPDVLASIEKWHTQHIAGPALERGIIIKVVFVSWDNKWRRPGPAFNYVTGVAYADGAEYIYRINDDIIFDNPWAGAMVEELLDLGPPYGVVGPACKQASPRMLIVDFTHRTHHDIFPQHYPPALASWYMDDWVTLVYGRERTKRVKSVSITHLTGSHGTRYRGMEFDAQYLRGELKRTQTLLELYLAHTPNLEIELDAYKADIAKGKYNV